MPVTSLHTPTGRWLTYSDGFEPGTECTLSIGHPLTGGECTTYRLGPVVAHDDRGRALFDLDEAEIKMNGEWFPGELLRRIRRECFSPGFVLRGVRYRYGSFGIYGVERPDDRPPWRDLKDYA